MVFGRFGIVSLYSLGVSVAVIGGTTIAVVRALVYLRLVSAILAIVVEGEPLGTVVKLLLVDIDIVIIISISNIIQI